MTADGLAGDENERNLAERIATPMVTADSTSLPGSADVIAAFRNEHQDRSILLHLAGELARQHQAQWDAETVSRRMSAAPQVVADSKRRIDSMNARRSQLIEAIDREVAPMVRRAPARMPLHTETLGSVIDRLGISWVRANKLIDCGDQDRARSAVGQLHELAAAYDDLVRDIREGKRRVPSWRLLKKYQAKS